MKTGHVYKYGANVDTDAIIPARYLNVSDRELARHHRSSAARAKCRDFIVAGSNSDAAHPKHAPVYQGIRRHV